MFTHPIIDRLAAIPLTALVTPSSEQKVDGETACFCPFCRQQRVSSDGRMSRVNQGGSETPHFIIYTSERGGLYGGGGVNRWMCTRTRRSGYGALELMAAIEGLTLDGPDLLLVIRKLCQRCGLDFQSLTDVIGQHADITPDGRKFYTRPQDVFSFVPRADFSPQELRSLGCEVSTDQHGRTSFSWGDDFNLHRDFRIYSLDYCIMPERIVRGEKRSEVLFGTPWDPLFVVFGGEQIDESGEGMVGAVFHPASDDDPIVFSNDPDSSVAKVSKWLAGDAVLMYAIAHRDSASTSVHAAIERLQTGESVNTTRKVWKKDINSKAEPIEELTEEKIPDSEIRARHVVHCLTPQDALTTYYTLRQLRRSYEGYTSPDGSPSELQQECWFHVSWMLGRGRFAWMDHGEWRTSRVEFGTVQHNKLARFAEAVYLLYPQSMQAERSARAISRRFRDVYFTQLPDTLRDPNHLQPQRCFGHHPQSVRDFVLCYRLFDDEAFQYDRDPRRYFYTFFKSALTSNPLLRRERRDKNGIVKEVFYTVSPSTVWTFMAGEGFFRDVDRDSENKIGRFVHIDGCFVEYLDQKSMVAVTFECLRHFAADFAPSRDEYALMLNGISIATREVNERTVSSLPVASIDFRSGYRTTDGRKVDHLFFKNCAVRITPDSISTIPYDQLTFNVDRTEPRPYNFSMPTTDPVEPYQCDEYQDRLAVIQQHADEVDADGHKIYSLQQVSKMRSELQQWGLSHRFRADWRGKRPEEMWKCLQVLRAFANVLWEEEEELTRQGKAFNPDQAALIDAYFCSILYAIGNTLRRDRLARNNAIPYLMEDSVVGNNTAQGGSGKSTLVNLFCRCAADCLRVDCKEWQSAPDKFALSGFIPHKHRFIHWEDWPKGVSVKYLYNLATSGFHYERKGVDKVDIEQVDAPGHIISSNYALSDTDDSTIGRFPICAFSNRFARENVMKGKVARTINDIWPGFTTNPEMLSPADRNQIVFICAKAIQFVMRYDDVIVQAPNENTKRRNLDNEFSKEFVDWANYFFSRKEVYGVPICIRTCMQEYIRDFSGTSEEKKQSHAIKRFYKRLLEWCEFIQVEVNPKRLLVNKKDQQSGFFHLPAWVEREYFTGSPWDQHATYQVTEPDGSTTRVEIEPKVVREWRRSDNVAFFFRSGVDSIPSDYDAIKAIVDTCSVMPDPLPIVDTVTGQPVTITPAERALLDRFNDSRTRQQASTATVNANVVDNNGGGTFSPSSSSNSFGVNTYGADGSGNPFM